MDDLLVTVTRQRPDGEVEYVAHSADPAVVQATVRALEQVLRGTSRRRVLRLAAAELEADAPGEGTK